MQDKGKVRDEENQGPPENIPVWKNRDSPVHRDRLWLLLCSFCFCLGRGRQIIGEQPFNLLLVTFHKFSQRTVPGLKGKVLKP
jgi:hypothetical protein